MAKIAKTRMQTEYGDFQTPPQLARQLCGLLVQRGISPVTIVEPTCGFGSILVAAATAFPCARDVYGVDINVAYVAAAREQALLLLPERRISIQQADFFTLPWLDVLRDLPDPLLIVGNLPWVTNSALSVIGSENLPTKQNDGALRGIQAVTGKSNFDISEWMLRQILTWIEGRTATVAMLCKTAVARKVMTFAWVKDYPLGNAALYRIDASLNFGATVDACLLVLQAPCSDSTKICADYPTLEAETPRSIFGLRAGKLVADIAGYSRWQHLDGHSILQWRSGIKHDCAGVMELRLVDGCYLNGLGERVELEPEYVYPMLKSSQLANELSAEGGRAMLVPQCKIGDDTRAIQQRAPRTWRYLLDHGAQLDGRGSRVYRSQPRFAVFGVGAYAFAPWKVAIAGFYKRLAFQVVGPYHGKPVVLDDTCYFLPCQSETAARHLAGLLNSAPAQEFLRSLVFWDAKRPITSEILGRLDITLLAKELGLSTDGLGFDGGVSPPVPGDVIQGALFENL